MFMMSTIDFQQYRKKQLSKKKQTITLTEGRILDYTDKNIQFIKKSIGLHELNKYEEGIEIALFDGMFHPKSIFIENNQFISIELYGGELLQEKQRSVLGRALVGGLLLGGIGAIVGGMSGTVNKYKYDDLVLEIAYGIDNDNKNLLFIEIPKKRHKEIQQYLKKNLFKYMK